MLKRLGQYSLPTTGICYVITEGACHQGNLSRGDNKQRVTTKEVFSEYIFFFFFFIVNDNIVLYINTFHTETGPLCQALRSFTNL